MQCINRVSKFWRLNECIKKIPNDMYARAVCTQQMSFQLFTVRRYAFYILHTWPHHSFQVIPLSMTLGIFQGHWTVSHQISQKQCVIRQKLL